MLRVALLCLTLALASASLESRWAVYKAKHGKSYTGEEDVMRQRVYEANLKTIKEHNERYARGETSFYLGENKFADMTTKEFASRMNGLRVTVRHTPLMVPAKSEDEDEGLPSTVDWRKKGYVTEVKDQGQCGSCWAFSSTGSVEGQHFKATGKLVSLSESNLVDCSFPEGNAGCGGGIMDDAFQYIIDAKGIDTEISYPYTPRNGKCKFNAANVGATISSYKDLPQGNENALKKAAATVGPISVAIDANHTSFQLYSGGVYDEPKCNSVVLDHGVLVVGYGTESGSDYWLVKNSWSADWGVKGYIKMSRNKNNQCGIATHAVYPIV